MNLEKLHQLWIFKFLVVATIVTIVVFNLSVLVQINTFEKLIQTKIQEKQTVELEIQNLRNQSNITPAELTLAIRKEGYIKSGEVVVETSIIETFDPFDPEYDKKYAYSEKIKESKQKSYWFSDWASCVLGNNNKSDLCRK